MTPATINRPLRIVFYRPHTEIWFKDPVRHLIRGESLPHKYEALFETLLRSGAEVSVSTALCRMQGWKGLIRYLLDPFALVYWVLGNKISLRKISFVFTKAGLRNQDVLFFMHYGNFTFEDKPNAQRGKDLAIALAGIDILKVGHLTHYAYQPVVGANNLKILNANLLLAENNLLRNSAFYQKYFGHLNAEFWCLPFIAADRFQCFTPFRQRRCKLVATGSITYKMSDDDFINFYHTDELQPLRRQIYEHAHEYSMEIDSIISDLNASRLADNDRIQSTWHRLLRRFRPHPQNLYYKKSIVDVYNSYMMFTVPEEVCDLPAIGVVEGMACGSAFFGLDSPMYRDLGIIPGVHYVAHDGTLSDLIDKVRYYQQSEHLAALESIAKNGMIFVHDRLRSEVVYSDFFERLTHRMNQIGFS